MNGGVLAMKVFPRAEKRQAKRALRAVVVCWRVPASSSMACRVVQGQLERSLSKAEEDAGRRRRLGTTTIATSRSCKIAKHPGSDSNPDFPALLTDFCTNAGWLAVDGLLWRSAEFGPTRRAHSNDKAGPRSLGSIATARFGRGAAGVPAAARSSRNGESDRPAPKRPRLRPVDGPRILAASVMHAGRHHHRANGDARHQQAVGQVIQELF